jgi:serine/threonine-protein kinase
MMKELQPKRTLGAWVVDEVLTMGTPTLARCHHHDEPARKAILKITRQHRMAQTWQDREVRALQSFSHPAIPRFLDSGRDGKLLFIALAPFPTHTLADRLFSGAPDTEQALSWLLKLASAVQHMHAQGWVHGDLHPRHLYVDDSGEAYIMGFASARPVDAPQRFKEEVPEGNYTYLAPEALEADGKITPRSDLYAVGCLAYQMLTGEPPFPAAAFAGRHDQAKMFLEWKQRQAELDPGAEHPDWLRVMVRKCTQSDPAQRLPDLTSAVAMLEASRPTWAGALQPVDNRTPMAAPRAAPLQPLNLQPTLDAKAIAREIVEQSLALRPEPPPPPPPAQVHPGVLLYVAASAGLAAGLAVSMLIVLYAELAYLG